jgi:hypothetical protein
MPTVQSTYSDNMAVGFHGMIADTSPSELVGRTAEAELEFGYPVIQGTEDNECAALAASTDVVTGITVRTADQESNNISQYDAALLMRRGSMWVTVGQAGGVDAGDDVWLVVSDGSFANADLGSGGGVKINNARWETTGADAALARIWFDLAGGVTAGAS